MGKNHTHLAWLSLPVQEWKEDNNYKDVDEVVTKLCVVNDPAERAVKAAGDRIGSVRSEKAFQPTQLTIDELPLDYSAEVTATCENYGEN